jgi:hypothetical protein
MPLSPYLKNGVSKYLKGPGPQYWLSSLQMVYETRAPVAGKQPSVSTTK